METDVHKTQSEQEKRIQFLETQIKRQLDEKVKVDQKHRAEVAEVRQQKADAIKLAENWKERYESSAAGGQAAALNRCQRELTEARSEIKLKSALFDEKTRIANETATFLANRHAEDVRIIETERLLYQHKQEGFETMEKMWSEKSKEYEEAIEDLNSKRGDRSRTSLSSVKEREYLKSIEQLSHQIAERNQMLEQAEYVFETLNTEKLAMTSEIQRKDIDLQTLAKELNLTRASEKEARNHMQDTNLSLDGAKRKIANLLKKQETESDERQVATSRIHKLELQLRNTETTVNDLRGQLNRILLEQRKKEKEWDDQRVSMQTEAHLHKQKVSAITACLRSGQPNGRSDIGQEGGEEEMNIETAEGIRSIAPLPDRNTPVSESFLDRIHSGPLSPKIILSPSSETPLHPIHPIHPQSSPRTRAPSNFSNLFSSPLGPITPVSKRNSKTMSTQPFRLQSQPLEPNPFLISSPRTSKRSSALEIFKTEQMDDSKDIGKGVAFKRMRLEPDRDDGLNRGNETISGIGISSFSTFFSPNSKRKMSSSPEEEEKRIRKE